MHFSDRLLLYCQPAWWLFERNEEHIPAGNAFFLMILERDLNAAPFSRAARRIPCQHFWWRRQTLTIHAFEMGDWNQCIGIDNLCADIDLFKIFLGDGYAGFSSPAQAVGNNQRCFNNRKCKSIVYGCGQMMHWIPRFRIQCIGIGEKRQCARSLDDLNNLPEIYRTDKRRVAQLSKMSLTATRSLFFTRSFIPAVFSRRLSLDNMFSFMVVLKSMKWTKLAIAPPNEFNFWLSVI